MPKRSVTQTLREHALRHPETQAGVACEGTAIEKTTVKAGNKAFLFLGTADAMLKLAASLPEATTLAKKEPTCWKVGANGWVTATFRAGEPPLEVLRRFIDESYALAIARPKKPKPAKMKAHAKKTAKKLRAKK